MIALVGLFNYFVEGNYMFLSDRPQLEHPAILFHWPYYLVLWSILFFLCSFGISRIFQLSAREVQLSDSENDLNLKQDEE